MPTPDAIQQTYTEQLAQLRGNRVLSTEARSARLARLHQWATDAMQEAQTRATADRASRVRTLEQRAFGGHYEGSAAIAARDAQDRASRLDNERDAAELYRTAARNGDESLCAAIAQAAHEQRWTGVASQFFADRPDRARAYEELGQVDNSTVALFMSAAQYVVEEPREIAGLTYGQRLGLMNDPELTGEPASA